MVKTLGVMVVLLLVFPVSAIAQSPIAQSRPQPSSQPPAAAAAGAEPAPAGEPGGQTKPGSAHATPNPAHPSLAQVAADCQMRCQRTTEAINDLDRRLSEARVSDDPARIKALLDQMERPLGEMRQHMLVCVDRLRQAR